MARIRSEDVAQVRERCSIQEVVAEQVTLRKAGVGSLKGLCPFHEEKSPSFNVRPQLGTWHCFGCGLGGDVIAFVQQIDHLSFVEAVERLATKIGYELRYEDDGGGAAGVTRRREAVGQRQRLVEAHRVAAEFYAGRLGESDGDAVAARDFLASRGFDRSACARFGVGFAPRSGEALARHLRGRGFTEGELTTSGLAALGRGVYDRFRGRVMWPIRQVTGDVVGFGARRLFDDDKVEAKYLNTPETPIYRKSEVLYGVDLAKRDIATRRQVVVVEGYTDVMACHLAGVTTAVATCGTAFAADHVKVVRRLLSDEGGGEVVFTFDGDEAGRRAALRAFADDQRFVAQTYIAVASDGLDPCDLRLAKGDAAVQALVAARVPLFDFALRSTIGRFDLDTAEGRVAALRAGAPIVAGIKDPTLRPEYARRLAGLLGMEVERVGAVVRRTRPVQVEARGSDGSDGSSQEPAQRTAMLVPDVRDPVAVAERELLKCALQQPVLARVAGFDDLGEAAFLAPAHRTVHEAVRAAGGTRAASSEAAVSHWFQVVLENSVPPMDELVRGLAVEPLRTDEAGVPRYTSSLVLGAKERELVRRKADMHSRMQRLDAAGGAEDLAAVLREAQALEVQLRDVRARAAGT